MVAPYCWTCAETSQMKRSKNRAIVLGLYTTRELLPLCGIHADKCKAAGGLLLPLPRGFEHESVGVEAFLEQQRTASLARYDPLLETLMYKAVRETLPGVVQQVMLEGALAVRARAGPLALQEETDAGAGTSDVRELVPPSKRTNRGDCK